MKTITESQKQEAVTRIMDRIKNHAGSYNAMQERICIGITKTGKISISQISAWICGVPQNSPIISGYCVDISDITPERALKIINQAIQGDIELNL